MREAFADMLPPGVAWRQKEQFSDGVGYSWIDTLKEVTARAVTDDEMAHAALRFPINPPRNKEEYYYRSIFEEYFPARACPQCAQCAQRGVLHGGSPRMGCVIQEHERAERTRCDGRTR